MHGRVVHLHVESLALRGNPLGDAARRSLYAYLPPGYDGNRRFPVVYLLAAFGGDGRSFLDGSPWKPSVVDQLDAAMAAGECRDSILAMPDASNLWVGSQYLDSPGSGAYQTYLVEEVVAAIDRELRTVPSAEGRAIVGRSSGGFGALRACMDRPGVFGALASHAGDAAFELSLRPMIVQAAICAMRLGDERALAEALRVRGPTLPGEHDAAFVLACAAAYAPRPEAAFPHLAWPFDPGTGEVDEQVFAEMREHDPLVRLAHAGDALRGLALAYVDAGTGDEHGLAFAARAMASGLERAGIPLRHELHEGGHRGTSYRFGASIPCLLAALP